MTHEPERPSAEELASIVRKLPPPPGQRQWRIAFFIAAAASVVLMFVAFVRPLPLAQRPLPTLSQLARVTLTPAHQGVPAQTRIGGDGPWLIDAMLPQGAPAGEYDVQLLDDGGFSVASVSELAAAEGRVEFFLRPIAPGHYRLLLATLEDPQAGPFAYNLRVAR